MSRRAKAWGRLARALLIEEMGGKCELCPVNFGLQFHLLGPSEPHHHLDSQARVSFYRRMKSAGRLRVLCLDCHRAEHKRETLRAFLITHGCTLLN